MGSSKLWPNAVPVISESDVCKGAFTKNDQHCMLGWVNATFKDTKTNRQVRDVVKLAIEADGYKLPPNSTDSCIMTWNDASRRSRAQIARAFNTATAALGYNKGNPENLRGYNLRRRIKSLKQSNLLPARVRTSV